MAYKMGMQFGLESGKNNKRKNRWLLEIDNVTPNPATPSATYTSTNTGIYSAGPTSVFNVLPPEKSARPSITFKEMAVSHLIEDVYLPSKPDWKPLNLTLYDIDNSMGSNLHPVWQWLLEFYDPTTGKMMFYQNNYKRFYKDCYLYLFDGCGNVIEKWVYQAGWPSSVDFQSLDMSDASVLTCDLTIRYARAYIAYDQKALAQGQSRIAGQMQTSEQARGNF